MKTNQDQTRLKLLEPSNPGYLLEDGQDYEISSYENLPVDSPAQPKSVRRARRLARTVNSLVAASILMTGAMDPSQETDAANSANSVQQEFNEIDRRLLNEYYEDQRLGEFTTFITKVKPELMKVEHDNFAEALTVLDEYYENDLENPLLPIFDPRVMRYKDIILESASRYQLDPNLVAFIIEQESDGEPNAKSGANALGLMQLTHYHTSRFDLADGADEDDMYRAMNGEGSNHPKEYYERKFTDPAANIEAGSSFVRELLDRSINNNQSINRDSARAFAISMIGYNYRPHFTDTADKFLSDLSRVNNQEAEEYAISALNKLIRITIGLELKAQGLSDAEITARLAEITPDQE